MKYLVFDIECCDGQHICEFGYVFIDENFSVLERDYITINPEHKFKLTGREHESDITLAFSEEIYFNSPTFDYYYDRIRSVGLQYIYDTVEKKEAEGKHEENKG